MIKESTSNKDRLIELLEILESIYSSNINIEHELNEKFKQAAELHAKKTSTKKETADSAAPSAPAASEEKKDGSSEQKMIDTTQKGAAGEEKSDVKGEVKEGEVEKAAGFTPTKVDTQTPIKMIRILIKLLQNNSESALASVEKSAFEEAQSQSASRYNTKQLQGLWTITLRALRSQNKQIDDLVQSGVLEEMIVAFLNSSE